MKYNFDEIVNRDNTASVKHDLKKVIFGTEDVIPMWVADMDFKTPDFIINAVKERCNHEIYGYSFRTDSYYKSIIDWLKRRHNWEIQKEWISFSPGVVPAINMAIMAFTTENDKIIIQPPVYHPFYFAIKNTKRTLVENPLKLENGRYTMDFDDLEVRLHDAKMLILSNPHNPGGTVWTKDELKKLGELCVKYNVLIMSDEIHADLVFKTSQFTPLASVSTEIADITVSFIAPSKTFNIAGLASSSVICSNKDLKEKFDFIVEMVHVGMGNVFGAVASEAAYTYGDEWLDQLIEYLTGNLDFLQKYIEENLPQIKMIRPEGTYLVWLDCSGIELKGKTLNDFMIDAGVGLNDGKIFGFGGEGFMRINIACPKKIISEALVKLKKAIN